MESSRTVTLAIRNMTCGHCVATVKKSLERVGGVRAADVSLDPPRAVVSCDPSLADVDRLTDATGKEGYPSTVVGR